MRFSDFIVKDSPISGKGLFANKDFYPGYFILNYRDDNWVKKKWVNLTNDEKRFYWFFPAFNKRECWICRDPKEFKYINHSRTPNGYWEIESKIIRANKIIRKGEEITIDYRNEIRPTREKWPDWI